MLLDEEHPRKKPELVFRKLDTLSVEALNEYIIELQNEILRAQEEIRKRGSARDMAESFFAKNPSTD